ncbi:MAG: 4-hydroxy-tetrahydrodipicolinate synthase [Urechidicola sp.]|jgi:4-hydroxy-tetrahydrodipicolinate synthase
MALFSGSLVAMVTPFRDGKLDEEALRHLTHWHIEQGTDGLVPVGTTGESPALSSVEHKRIIEIVVTEAAGRVPVVAGAGSNNPIEAIEYSLHAEEVGADGLLHVAGYYNRPNQSGLYAHFKMVHDACNLPIILYNIPPRAIVDIEVETMAKLAELSRIVGVKDATCDLSRPLQERMHIKSEFTWLSGEDATAVAYNAGGGNGCISVTANVAPALCAKMQKACTDGDFVKALAIQDDLMALHSTLFAEPSPAGAKYAVSRLGLCGEDCRVPVMPLSTEAKNKIDAAMDSLGLLA